MMVEKRQRVEGDNISASKIRYASLHAISVVTWAVLFTTAESQKTSLKPNEVVQTPSPQFSTYIIFLDLLP